MELLKRAELPVWLLQKFGSASDLAEALGVTRQTAHNLLTGRTLPSYETCEKLGLDPVFLLRQKKGSEQVSSLNDFLAQRNEQVQLAQARQRGVEILRANAQQAWTELQAATRDLALNVGGIDGISFDWDKSAFLKLESVAAVFASGTIVNGVPQRTRVIFGRIPYAMYSDERAPKADLWNLAPSLVGDSLVWDVNGAEFIAMSTADLAEQIIKHLVQYRDTYNAYSAKPRY